ncbi:MAG TPA: FkbM family methyltransferase, partial [Mucilaginibacter sp.]
MNRFKRTLGFIFDHPLGKRHPVRALARFTWWQCQTLLFPSRFFKKSFVKPVDFYVKKGLYGLTTNVYTGLHEFYDMSFLLHFLREGDVFFDVGANAGSYTLLASGICKAKSITIEPVRSTFDVAYKNVHLNNLQNVVKLINAGAGAKEGSMNFTADEDITNHVIAEDEVHSANVITVPIITIDSIQAETYPLLIKIDVEGFETEVLKGMENTLKGPSLKAIIIE